MHLFPPGEAQLLLLLLSCIGAMGKALQTPMRALLPGEQHPPPSSLPHSYEREGKKGPSANFIGTSEINPSPKENMGRELPRGYFYSEPRYRAASGAVRAALALSISAEWGGWSSSLSAGLSCQEGTCMLSASLQRSTLHG